MKKIIYIAIMVFCINTIFAQRNVVWVHGLGGDDTSWQHYNNIFDTERNINSLRNNYNTSNGITFAASQVINSVNVNYGGTANNNNNLAIGHSMGGLMIRDVDRLQDGQPKNFGGYITLATPNYGAPIANSLSDGSVDSAATDACNKLTDGPLSQLFGLPWAVASNLATDELCDYFTENNTIQNYAETTSTNDLKEGSTAINRINNYTDNNNPSIPRISIWAQEDSPVHWRMASTYAFNDDQILVDKVNSGRNKYHNFYAYNVSMTVASGVFGIFNPFSWGSTAIYGYRASQWKKGRNWIDDSENIWSSLIKTTKREPQHYWAEVWVPCSYPPLGPILVDPITNREVAPDPNCGEWVWRQQTRYVNVNYPSDGLLPKYTQELKGILRDNKYRVNGANHLEVRNMTNDGNSVDETKVVFDDIFDRTGFFGTNRN